MSTSDQPTPPPAPQRTGPISPHGMRLVWSLRDPLESAISVMPENLDPEAPREQYFQQSSTGSNWHSISKEPLTEAKVSCTAVESTDLSNWLPDWCLDHMEHADGSDDDDGGGDDNSGDEDSANKPCRGCGELPPPEYDALIVEASDMPYITIHDYITAVHPWLMSHRQEILEARNVNEGVPPDPDTKLMVWPGVPDLVNTETEEEWKRGRKFHYNYINRTETPFDNAGPKGKKRRRDDE